MHTLENTSLLLGEQGISRQRCEKLKRKMIRIAQREEKVWYHYTHANRRRKLAEGATNMLSRLEAYWRSVPRRRSTPLQLARGSARNSIAWSAVFISWVMQESRIGRNLGFRPSAAHMDYIRQAILNRENNRTNRPFWGFRISEVSPMVGDFICLNRSGTNHTYDRVKNNRFRRRTVNGRRVLDRRSHCDLVIDKFTTGGRTFIEVVGGNVGDSVSSKFIPIPGDRYPTRRTYGLSGNIFAILRLQGCPHLSWELNFEPPVGDFPIPNPNVRIV